MAEPSLKPILQKPPVYRDSISNPAAKPIPKPPVRKPMLPVSQKKPRRRRRSCCRGFCYFLCVLILILIIVTIAAGGILYLWFEPKLPVFHLQSFRISQFNVTDKTDGTYLDVKTISRIEVRNPNGKLTVYYGDSEVEIDTGDGIGLGSVNFRGFIQAIENVTSLKVETVVKNESVDGGTGRRLNSGHRSKEMVVNVAARTAVGLVVGGRRTVAVKINVVCGGVSLKGLERGDMPKCSLYLRKWFF